jgi:cobalamin biosynthesis protein CobW
MSGKLPATIVTGFLGAGKTSLLRHLVENANGRRLAFIINEFGDLGIDRGMLVGCGIPDCDEGAIRELTNGCLCCTVADDFLPTMEALLARDPAPDHIIIETSGLALPKPLLQAFAWPGVATKATVDGVITVLDGPAIAAGRFADDPEAVAAQRDADEALDHDNPLAEVFDDQVACADLVIVNKSDLLDEVRRAYVEGLLDGKLRPGVKRLAASHGKLPLSVLLGLGKAAEHDLASRPSLHDGLNEHDHDDFESFVLPLAPIADAAGLVRRIANASAAHDILRVKGFAAVTGAARRCVIQGVGARIDRYFDRDWGPDETPTGALVVIGRRGLDQAAITATITG